MTYSASLILDVNAQAGQIYVSTTFENARFILIDTSDLPQEEAFDFGLSLNIIVPLPERIIRKNVALLPETVVGIFDTFYVVQIPTEIGDSQYLQEIVIGMPPGVDDSRIKVYAYQSDISQDSLDEKLDEILDALSQVQTLQTFDVAEDIAQVANSIQNNVSFIALAGSLAPITAGASLASIPNLLQGTAGFTTLLLPGI